MRLTEEQLHNLLQQSLDEGDPINWPGKFIVKILDAQSKEETPDELLKALGELVDSISGTVNALGKVAKIQRDTERIMRGQAMDTKEVNEHFAAKDEEIARLREIIVRARLGVHPIAKFRVDAEEVRDILDEMYWERQT